MITLENRENRLVCYEIPTSVGGGQTHLVARVHRTSDAQNRSAGKELTTSTRKLPTSITLTAKGTNGSTIPVPDSYATVPEIQKAIAAGKIVVGKHKSEAPAKPGDGK